MNEDDEVRKLLASMDTTMAAPNGAKAFSRTHVSKEEIAEWLERGKAAQRAHIASLTQDPKWIALATRGGVPGYRQNAENLSAEHNGAPTIPADSEKRKTWASEQARKTGWLQQPEREPGDEDLE